MGVWIETSLDTLNDFAKNVTPFVGVWIETKVTLTIELSILGHTLRGCVD